MTARRFTFALAAFVLAPLALAAAEKYTLKIERPAQVGDRTKHTIRDNTEFKNVVRNADGAVLQEKVESKDTNAVYEDTILAKDGDKRAHKISRKYESITHSKDGKKFDLGLVGKVVIIEWEGGAHKFRYEGGGAVTGDTLEYLREDFKNKDEVDRKMDRAIMPKTPVAVGESWMCDMDDIAKSLGKDAGDGIDRDKSTAACKLVKVYSQDGATFGIIETTITFVPSRIGPANAGIKNDAGSKMVFKLTLDACIDGSRTEGTMSGGMTLDLGGSLSQGGQDFTIKITGKGKMSQTRVPLK